MNVHESEKIAGILMDEGFEATARETDADIIVFNTCCIRETAEAKIMGHIGQIKKIKKARPELKVAVCGCMSQQEGAAQLILDKFPFVDAVLGTANLHLLKEVVAKADNTSKNRFFNRDFLGDNDNRHQRMGKHNLRLQQFLHLLHSSVCERAGTQPPRKRYNFRG